MCFVAIANPLNWLMRVLVQAILQSDSRYFTSLDRSKKCFRGMTMIRHRLLQRHVGDANLTTLTGVTDVGKRTFWQVVGQLARFAISKSLIELDLLARDLGPLRLAQPKILKEFDAFMRTHRKATTLHSYLTTLKVRCHTLTHSLTHSRTHSLTHSLPHSLTHSLTH